MDRLPPLVQRYLRLVGPAILAALAAGNTAFAEDAAGNNTFHRASSGSPSPWRQS